MLLPHNCLQMGNKEIIKPSALFYEIRKSVSEILNKPFSEKINHQIFQPEKKVLAIWARECCEHVLPYFEEKYPNDNRPRKALEILEQWIDTGLFNMAVIRKASLDAHTAAKNVKEDYAKYVAHAAGQAVATAHVSTHAFGSSIYSIRAAVSYSRDANNILIQERNWQIHRLKDIIKDRSVRQKD